jgi:DNA helicase-2/ATP-dependent DNA helicase PcrA
MEKATALLESLDPEQQKAATAPIGPVRIVAGAGTGKTRTLIHRIAYWHHMGIAPANKVLAVTFTRKSASELRHRLGEMGITGVTAQTFHAAALSQLREFWVLGGQKSDFPEMLTGKDQYFAIRRAITQSLKPSEDPKQPRKKVDTVLQRNFNEELTMIRSRMIDLKTYLESENFSGPSGSITKAEFVEAVQRYEDMKRASNKMDYADALIRCVRMIENVPHVAEKIRSRYEHFLVDEYQDNDPVQERLLDAWLGGRKSICVVGDPRQTIFSFKGADPKIMRDFPSKHQGVVTVELTRNYRSSKQIIEWANRMMRDTTASGGAKSELSSTGSSGWNPQVRSYYTEKVELEQTAIRIKQMTDRSHIELGDVAVLLRFRADIAKVRRSLSVAGIQSVSPNDEFWSDVEPVLRDMKKNAHDSQLMGRQALVEALNELQWISKTEDSETEDDEYSELGQNLLEITDSIEGIESMNVAQVLDVYKALEGQGKDATDGAAVNVMTIHQAKGLEWDAVFIPRFVEGALPTSHAKSQDQHDEERRLAYVGITRARKYLELSWGETYKFKDRSGVEKNLSQSVSSFEKYLKEVAPPKQVKTDPKTAEWSKRFQPPARKLVQSQSAPKKPVPTKPLTGYEMISGSKETVGSVVRHKDLGEGKIIAVAASYAIVDFGKEGRFKIDLPPY